MEPITNNVLYLYSGYGKLDGYLAMHAVPIVASGIGGLLALRQPRTLERSIRNLTSEVFCFCGAW
jgi:hypothetical protein